MCIMKLQQKHMKNQREQESSIKITFQGEERKIKFGSWVTGNIEKLVNKDGYGNIELLASLIFFGLIMGEKLRASFTANEKLPFDIFDCYDWIDEVGGITSDEVQRIQNLYVKHNEMNVPKDEKKKK